MTTLFELFDKVIDLVNVLIYLIISLALVGFLWGVVRFLFSGSNEKLRTEGRKFMLYGILTLFVMTSMWSIIYLFKDFIGEDYVGDINSGDDGVGSPQQAPFEDIDDLFENNNPQMMI